ncbi:DUF6497 family protein [Planktotalea sp.]|uniref:DUF6497 family protein n=1 Tax=Planktotalea sp. TaxID=2029877 RepID=UPI003D6C5630
MNACIQNLLARAAKAIGSVLACTLCFSGLALAQLSVAVPSGQTVTFLEKRVDLEANIVRLRFVAPDLASPLTRPSFEAIGDDLEALCSEFGLKELLKDAPRPNQIVVSLSAQPIEFGVADTDVQQVFEAFSVQNETCMLEMF